MAVRVWLAALAGLAGTAALAETAQTSRFSAEVGVGHGVQVGSADPPLPRSTVIYLPGLKRLTKSFNACVA